MNLERNSDGLKNTRIRVDGPESKAISESDVVKDIVSKNRNLLTVASRVAQLIKRLDRDSRKVRSRFDITALVKIPHAG